MRKIRLSDTDAALFGEEMIPSEYEFLARHKDTFCRMWLEQGKTFWTRYAQVFGSYIVRYSPLGELPCDGVLLKHALDHAFMVINKNYVEGKVNQARTFTFQVADLGRNRHRFIFLDSKSVSKDPFYTPDTRDLFRDFFGQAKEKASYIRAYLLTPVYMRFGGSIVRCLIRWKDATEMDPSDESYFVPPETIANQSCQAAVDHVSVLCSYHQQDCNFRFWQQFAQGNPNSPVSLGFWRGGDPRFEVPGNPLWNPAACDKPDWRDGLTIEKFQKFYVWCSFCDALVKPEDQCSDCRIQKKAKKKKKKKKKTNIATADFDATTHSISAHGDTALAELVGGENNSKSKISGVVEKRNKFTQTCVLPEFQVVLKKAERQKSGKTAPQKRLTELLTAEDAAHLPMEARIKYLKKRKPVFSHNSLTRERMEVVKVPYYGGDITAHFALAHRSEFFAAEVIIHLTKVEYCEVGQDNPSKQGEHAVLGTKVFPTLTAHYLSQTVDGFPPGAVCAEKGNWCATEVDYTGIDRDTERPTHFILTVSNTSNSNLAKELMIELLWYIVRRKKRSSSGWIMRESDVFAFCQTLGKSILQITGVYFTISISDLSCLESAASPPDFLDMSPTSLKKMAASLVKTIFPDNFSLHCEECLNETIATQTSEAGCDVSGRVHSWEDDFENLHLRTVGPESVLGKPVLPAAPIESKKPSTCSDIHSDIIRVLNSDEVQSGIAEERHKSTSLEDAGSFPVMENKNKKKKKKQHRSGEQAQNVFTHSHRTTTCSVTQPFVEAGAVPTAQASETETSRQLSVGKVKEAHLFITPGSLANGFILPVLPSVVTLPAADGDNSQPKSADRKFSVCSHCGKTEPVLRTFKKCQRCKIERVASARYYCGRPCQQEDWKYRHCLEHARGILH